MNNNKYVRLSLELHLFFAWIMLGLSFLEAAFTEKNNDLKTIREISRKLFLMF